VGDVELAEQLCTGIKPLNTGLEAALAASQAQIEEARGDRERAAETFQNAAERLGLLGAGLERAFAVLGKGRCLASLQDPSAQPSVREARRLFAEMSARPRIDECDTLIAQTSRLSS
jgi:hypothetical protein